MQVTQLEFLGRILLRFVVCNPHALGYRVFSVKQLTFSLNLWTEAAFDRFVVWNLRESMNKLK